MRRTIRDMCCDGEGEGPERLGKAAVLEHGPGEVKEKTIKAFDVGVLPRHLGSSELVDDALGHGRVR